MAVLGALAEFFRPLRMSPAPPASARPRPRVPLPRTRLSVVIETGGSVRKTPFRLLDWLSD